MSNFKVSSKLAAASLLAIAAALAAPSAFADNHYRGADRGQVSHDHGPSRDSHRDRRDNRGHHNGNRQDNRGHAQPQYRPDSRTHGRVVSARQPGRSEESRV